MKGIPNFREYMEGIAKGINVFGDTLKPYQYYEMFKYGRQATSGLSEKFILGTAPTLAQELGGSSYGRAVSAFNAAIVGGVMKTKAVDEFFRLGLLTSADVKTQRSGEMRILPGHNVAGWREAQIDPNAWVKEYLIPALDRLGIKDKSDVLREITTLFQNQMAGQMVGLLATQQSRIDKDLALLGNAPGLAAADKAMREDPALAWQGLKAASESLIATVGQSLNMAGPMTDLAQAIALNTLAIQEEMQAQNAGKPSPAIEDMNRRLNRRLFGVDTADVYEAEDLSQRSHDDEAYRAKMKDWLKRSDLLEAIIRANPSDDEDTARLAALSREAAAGTAAWRDTLAPRGLADQGYAMTMAREARAEGRDPASGGKGIWRGAERFGLGPGRGRSDLARRYLA
jgi:hypothetical protein